MPLSGDLNTDESAAWGALWPQGPAQNGGHLRETLVLGAADPRPATGPFLGLVTKDTGSVLSLAKHTVTYKDIRTCTPWYWEMYAMG